MGIGIHPAHQENVHHLQASIMEKLRTIYDDVRLALSMSIPRSDTSSQKTIVKHTRAIVSDQAFITGVTHEDIMMKYQIRTARSLLEQAHSRELELEMHGDWMTDPAWNQVISEGLQVAAQQTEPASDAEQEVWACPVCHEQFGNTAALKIHAKCAHKLVDQPRRIFDRSKHALHGLPQCAGCHRKFSRWQALEQHVNNNSCPATVGDIHQSEIEVPKEIIEDKQNSTNTHINGSLAVHASQHQPLPEPPSAVQIAGLLVQQALVQDIAAKGLNHFIQQPILHIIFYNIVLYVGGQWIASQKVMKTHYQNTHKGLYNDLQAAAQRLRSPRKPRLGSPVTSATGGPRTGKHTCVNVRCYGNVRSCVPTRMHGVDQEMADFFGDYQEMGELPGAMGPHGPPKNPFSIPNKRRCEPLGTYRQTTSPFQNSYRPGPQQPRRQHRDPLLFTLAKTVLKQQEELQVLRQDTAFILFMKPGEHSEMSHKTAINFKTKQEAEPDWKLGQLPLRMVLAVALFKELTDCLNQVLASQEKLKKAVELGWRDEAGWRFQRWNPTLKHLEVALCGTPCRFCRTMQCFS